MSGGGVLGGKHEGGAACQRRGSFPGYSSGRTGGTVRRKRLAIVRRTEAANCVGACNDPWVQFLILDEGVSAIDVATANEIEQELLNMQDLTLLTITHRIKDGLTSRYDRVLLLENGRLVERA